MQEPNDHGSHQEWLPGRERQDARRRSSPRPVVVYQAIWREGVEELGRPSRSLAWSGLAAGLSMGFSFVTEAALMAHLPERPWQPVLTKLGYSVGFLIVILGRQQLFTENTLKPILPLLERRDLPTVRQLMRLWVVVLTANLAGAWLFALGALYTDAFPPALQRSFQEISEGLLPGGFVTTMLGAIYAGWLIALMMWLLPFAETGRIGVIIILAYVIGLGEFPHVIAGSVPALYEAMSDTAPLRRYLCEFLAPVLLGNVIGGVALVAVINYAQVATYVKGSR